MNGAPARAGAAVATFEVDAERHDPHLLAGDAEIAGHVVPVVLADRQERVHVPACSADQRERLACAIGSPSPSRNRSSPCSVQQIGRLQLALERLRQAEQQRIRQVDDVEPARSRSQSSSLAISLRWKPCSPRSIETVISPRLFGSTLI